MRQVKSITIILITILKFVLVSVSNAQVINGSVNLFTQAEVNSFTGSSITGFLSINGTNGSDIIDLTPLSTLTSVGGNLNIVNNVTLTNLDGLNNLVSVGGDLALVGNDILGNINSLGNLTSVGRALRLGSNDSLTNIDGLLNLTSLGSLFIDTTELKNIDGLRKITSLDKMDIRVNGQLKNINGLGNLTSLGGTFFAIISNARLTNLDGLSNLTSYAGDLLILSNDSLNSFCGLYPLMSSMGLKGSYSVFLNLVNPTQQQIIDLGSCTTPVNVANQINPLSYKLQQNYPNPFNPQTTIAFEVKEFTEVSLKLFNIRGQLISTLFNKKLQPGQYNVPFNAGNLASGVYIYHIKMGKYQSTKKMILLQ